MKQIRNSKFSKFIAYYLVIMMFLQVTQPVQMYALTSGPTQPEFNAFTPIGTSDMVDLTSGDFNYNIPIMDVGGYPLNLAYNSGITMDQEASWVGLGWNLNVGQIGRQVRGLPDDFRGDKIEYHNNLRNNITIGTNFNLSPALFGNDTPFTLGLGAQYNNYEGVTFKPSVGVSYQLAGGVQVGVDLTGSVGEGATLTPSVSISKTEGNKKKTLGLSAGLSSRKGLENMSMSASTTNVEKNKSAYKAGMDKYDATKDEAGNTGSHSAGGGGVSGHISFNNSHNYTPSKRIAFDNINNTFNATIGGEVFGLEGQVRITGYGSYQQINEAYKNRSVGAYGYENTQYKNDSEGVLDFNRENEQVITKNTNVLPVTSYTYDVYSIDGQGVSGMFRPFKSQVGYLYNDEVSDFGFSGIFGAELGLGNLVHGGIDLSISPSTSSTGRWANKNYALPLFTERSSDKNSPLYQSTTFKLIGELDVDNERNIYKDKVYENKPLRFAIGGGSWDRSLSPIYLTKSPAAGITGPTYTPNRIFDKIKRKGRLLRNQTVQKITNSEADDIFVFKNKSGSAKPHHTAGIKILQTDGTTYVYGKALYNTKKVEATFDVSGSSNVVDAHKGIVRYGNPDLDQNNSAYSDKYVNKITTPGYAHSYLITSVLSSDYEDIQNDGPTDNDLGTYTKFDYAKSGDVGFVNNYKWRTPHGLNEASFNEGLKTSHKDQKGNYLYGEKELAYLKVIETKTHVAFIDLEPRKDARGVRGENVNANPSEEPGYMYCIKSIRLFSKPELIMADISLATAANINNPISVKPIKTAHFDYSYRLCPGTPNNFEGTKGKLTLEKVYFTYRNSNMGKFTPYVFNYSESFIKPENPDNPVPFSYNMKGFDIWGNFKENPEIAPLSTTDFPFVNQDERIINIPENKTITDEYASAWVLNKVTLPSGGVLNIKTESDDYKYVQNKKAMQMFKVEGAGNASSPGSADFSSSLFSNQDGHKRYIYVKLSDRTVDETELNEIRTRFNTDYLSENKDKPIYFKFLLNMNHEPGSQDYVSGYFEISNQHQTNVFARGGKPYAAIPLKFLRKDGGWSGSDMVNPIAKSGWGFGRTYLNRAVYSPGGAETNDDFVSIVQDLVGSIAAMTEIFRGPNAVLETKGCAKVFDTQRSWVRLENPDGRKLGGGLRVKRVELSDNWDVMNSLELNSIYKDIYEEKYGQEYSYDLTDGSSSGVATFEPNASPENALVEPFYGKDGQKYAERIGAPKELNYAEKPFGEGFFPSPKITYSRVTVSNIEKMIANSTKVIKKHATGKVVTEHYTSYDFPTIVDYTDIDIKPDNSPTVLSVLLDIVSLNHLTATQGFSIETNDMDGKVKSQKVYAEDKDPLAEPISRVDYIYNEDATGKLNNELLTINSKGEVKEHLLGVNYDMINDFNESNSTTETVGFDGNLAAFLVGIFPGFAPTILPKAAYHESILRTATTTKVIHKTGILIEKVAYDLGSKVSTKNMAWDAKTGQVLLTQTINEFDDKYYSFNYPAYWYYEGMGMASENIDLEGKLIPANIQNGNQYFKINNPLATGTIDKYFKIGDEIVTNAQNYGYRLWVVGYNSSKSGVKLMDRTGEIVKNEGNQFTSGTVPFKVVRSGYRNQQMASMQSVTSMTNPITDADNDGNWDRITNNTFGYTAGSVDNFDRKVINASAIEYSNDWLSQCENGLPNEFGLIPNEFGLINPTGKPVNPYLYNIKGDWRAIKSYAYLTGRNNFLTSNRRKTGYFDKFDSFYRTNNSAWAIDSTSWTFASRVTKYSPYGVELENRDALNRYSAAQYGYGYKLPVAVASNSRYGEIGFDGFEDYYTATPLLKPHFGFSQALVSGSAEISSQNSHTGKKSVAITAGNKVTFIRKIGGCKTPEEEGESQQSKQKTKKVIKLKKG